MYSLSFIFKHNNENHQVGGNIIILQSYEYEQVVEQEEAEEKFLRGMRRKLFGDLKSILSCSFVIDRDLKTNAQHIYLRKLYEKSCCFLNHL